MTPFQSKIDKTAPPVAVVLGAKCKSELPEKSMVEFDAKVRAPTPFVACEPSESPPGIKSPAVECNTSAIVNAIRAGGPATLGEQERAAGIYCDASSIV